MEWLAINRVVLRSVTGLPLRNFHRVTMISANGTCLGFLSTKAQPQLP